MTSLPDHDARAEVEQPRWERLLALALLAAVVALAAWLRLESLGEPNFWLDEVIGQNFLNHALTLPWWEWLAGGDPKDGLVYHLVLLAGRLGGESEAAARALPALIGIATVPLFWWTARNITRDSWAALAGAILLCVSPSHVFYSREARAPVIVVFLTLLLLHAVSAASWRLAGAALLLMLFTSAGAMPVAGAAFFAALAAAELVDEPARRRLQYIAGAAVIAVEIFPLLYALARGSYSAAGTFPGIDLTLVDSIVRGLSVTAHGSAQGGRAAWAILAAAAAGAVALWRRNRVGAAIAVLFALLPIVFVVGALKLKNDYFATRYVAASVIGYCLLAGCGMAWLSRLAARRFAAPVTMVLAALLAAQAWPNARLEPFRKLEWRSVAEAISAHARPGDFVVAAEEASRIPLAYYLDRTRRPIPVRVPAGMADAEAMVAGGGRWLASIGFSPDPTLRQWMCRYPLLLASPIESFRVHYAPSLGHFLSHRIAEPERRVLARAIGGRARTITVGPENEALMMGGGWWGAERAGTSFFRWAGERASVVVPWSASGDAVVRVRLVPFHHPSLPAQTLTLLLNGTEVSTRVLAQGWQDLSCAVPRAAWREAVNVLEMRFGYARRPADFDPAATDERQLAAAVEWIAVDPAEAVRRDPLATATPMPHVRLEAARFLEEKTAWRGGFTHLPAERLRREEVEALLARLGFDPQATWPRIAAGEVFLDEVVEIVAQDGGCLDDLSFVRRAFELLYDRPPQGHEEHGMMGDLRSGVSRTRLVGRLVKTPEFRKSVMK